MEWAAAYKVIHEGVYGCTYSSHRGFTYEIIWTLCNSMKRFSTLYYAQLSCSVSTFFPCNITSSSVTPSSFFLVLLWPCYFFVTLSGVSFSCFVSTLRTWVNLIFLSFLPLHLSFFLAYTNFFASFFFVYFFL